MEIGFYRFIFILMNFLDNICYKFYAWLQFSESEFSILVQLIVYCDCKYCTQSQWIGGRERKWRVDFGRDGRDARRSMRNSYGMEIPYRNQNMRAKLIRWFFVFVRIPLNLICWQYLSCSRGFIEMWTTFFACLFCRTIIWLEHIFESVYSHIFTLFRRISVCLIFHVFHHWLDYTSIYRLNLFVLRVCVHVNDWIWTGVCFNGFIKSCKFWNIYSGLVYILVSKIVHGIVWLVFFSHLKYMVFQKCSNGTNILIYII